MGPSELLLFVKIAFLFTTVMLLCVALFTLNLSFGIRFKMSYTLFSFGISFKVSYINCLKPNVCICSFFYALQ